MRRRFVVTGPPNSGKSTYAKTHAQPGDLVWDWDLVAEQIAPGAIAAGAGITPDWLLTAMTGIRERIVADLESGRIDPGGVFLIVTRSSTANRIALAIQAEIVELGK